MSSLVLFDRGKPLKRLLLATLPWMRCEGDNDDRDPEECVVLPIEESFDLHHFRPSEVLKMLDAYLDAALEEGLREVRLIHGRGKGVQRAQVRQFLRDDGRVERFEQAPPARGGWGATVAWLREPPGRGRPSAV